MAARGNMSNKSKQKSLKVQDTHKNGFSLIIGCFVLVVLCIFPLVYHDYYYDILETKYLFFCLSVILMVIAILLYGLIKGKIRINIEKFIHTLTIPDWALLSFLGIAAISTVCSEYRFEAFWGNEGRYTGLFLLLLYGITYFLVTRFLEFKKWYLDAFLGAGILAAIFGITDYFQMDILDFKADMKQSQYDMFSSTIGNINTYTAYIALIVAVAAILFATSASWKKMIWYYICFVVSLTALIMGASDNAYLALGALLGLSPLYLFATRKGVRSYFIILATFFCVIQLIQYINIKYEDIVLGIDSIFNVFAKFDKLNYIILSLWGIAAIFCVMDILFKNEHNKLPNYVRYIWLALVIAIAIGILYVLYDANILGNGEKYGSLQKYLVINDSWGTTRGYIWRIGIENYNKFDVFQKIFGFGPDTFGIITVNNNYDDMVNKYKMIFDSAHNEYLQYLITIGIAGLTAYVVLLISAFVRIARKNIRRPYGMAILFALICYNVQALVNINLPIATPIMWILLMVGLSMCNQTEENNSVEMG